MLNVDRIMEYLVVSGWSSIKFIFGPGFGQKFQLTVFETAIFTTLGMMLSVVVVSFFGEKLRNYYIKKFKKERQPVKLTKKKRKIIRIWNNYGIKGIAFLTPWVTSLLRDPLISCLNC